MDKLKTDSVDKLEDLENIEVLVYKFFELYTQNKLDLNFIDSLEEKLKIKVHDKKKMIDIFNKIGDIFKISINDELTFIDYYNYINVNDTHHVKIKNKKYETTFHNESLFCHLQLASIFAYFKCRTIKNGFTRNFN